MVFVMVSDGQWNLNKQNGVSSENTVGPDNKELVISDLSTNLVDLLSDGRCRGQLEPPTSQQG